MNIIIEPVKLTGSILAPPSKSAAHRILIAAALATQASKIILSEESEDTRATRKCLQALGAQCQRQGETIAITPVSIPSSGAELNCGESGSTLRFLLPVAASLSDKVKFTGHGRLPDRPLSPFREELQAHGCEFSADKLPFTISGKLRAGRFCLPGNISSQFISGLLFALPRLEKDSRIELSSKLESSGYVDLSREILADFGIVIEQENNAFNIPGRQSYLTPGQIAVEGDWSNAAFYLAAGALSGPVEINGLKKTSSQGDRRILHELRRFGATVEECDGGIMVSPGDLQATDIDVGEIPDLLPILAVLAAFAEGKSLLYNAARLRIKESDRLQAVREMLHNLGGKVEEREDSLLVYGQKQLQGGVIDSHNDHRIVMAAAIAACRCQKAVRINNAKAVRKSWPNFFSVYANLGGKAKDVI
ncbi:MAG: 3-phosphoshikimate 1-carboxyvinyltransferase [Porticoccaceae bacterium]|nr:3-phosphoshikimate 1-carboxyvinyltransferase [Porticoccaceae bacterium]